MSPEALSLWWFGSTCLYSTPGQWGLQVRQGGARDEVFIKTALCELFPLAMSPQIPSTPLE